MDCSDYTVDGIQAAANAYPDVRIKHTLRLCNYNNENQINFLRDRTKRVQVHMYHPIGNGLNSGQNDLVFQTFNGQTLRAGQCVENVGTSTVSTSRAKYFMEGYLQGTQSNSNGQTIEDGFCYAYAYNKVDFKYDYNLGFCDIQVSK